ncbi:MAG: tetratricopeptide repeat protein [Bacteroidota bacterium]
MIRTWCLQKRSYLAKAIITVFMLGAVSVYSQEDSRLSALVDQFEYERALAYIDSLECAGRTVDYTALKAKLYKGLNRYPEAARQYRILFDSDTTDIQVLSELGSCYGSMGDQAGAREYYRRALEISPQNAFFLQKMADAYFQDDHFTGALACYRQALSLDSSYYLLKQTGRCYDNLEQTDSAILMYRKAVEATRIDLQTSYRLAVMYRDKELYDSALVVTGHHLGQDSLNLRMLKLHGYLYFLGNDFGNAVQTFEKCLALNDISEFTNKYIGFSYFKTEEYDSAMKYLERAFLTDTADAELSYILGLACDKAFYRERGIGYLKKSIALLTPPPDLLSRIYQDLAAANTGFYRYDEALADYMKAMELTPGDTLLLFRIASHYDVWIRDRGKALDYYNRFLETRPKGDNFKPGKVYSEGTTISYYDYAKQRIGDIREELFWEGKKPEEE